MVNLQPFRATYYNPERIPSLNQVLTPPYDVISAAQQDGYYAQDPHSFIRIDYGKRQETDHEQDNVYTRAAATLKTWLAEGVFTSSAEPGLYLHTLHYQHGQHELSRTDLFVLCETTPFEAQNVLPHEKTIEGPKADRLSLLEATQTHLSPVFALYSDHEGFLNGYFEQVQSQAPLFQFKDHEGIQHSVWYNADPEAIGKVQHWFRERQLFIADGHHRYETALNYKRRHAQETPHYPAQDHVCMYLSNIYDPGLLVLPTHRLLKPSVPLPSLDVIKERLSKYFRIESADPAALPALLAQASEDETAIGIEMQGQGLLLKRAKGLPDGLLKERSASYRGMDVSVLHDLILYQELEFPKEWAKNPDYILFSPDWAQIRTWLADQTGTVGFCLNATAVQELCGVALAGETMPPKSTYFYPKMPSGILLARFEDAL
ncbi:hypothetical protein COW36_01775 [bacterium (Candidatus Blackallbacteria) CG17_big_fil_post_rev_8_21_14_2_50_48_46]|uniref:DUF1015 domain-containing protein n=1 Tax=bacterium (Candidatus Blackallbacteria) CG17_big_fil_post_rev_8_21_14_2_50_48_46 TaxID=2014261 RepID=A0A2M7GAN6_9BACT|nr:MAG: hypothetical protein COW64_26165 [bacterium (Candidatus Blackallbacteria) CG18_big_fil_WC_8_21_14_2_50_49_26]PIW19165.1 MAG: hypothetical protein COW36_01775 [bacterium (Candidatus Blackallbacteria) CG17_big_fil_post_rev_8_21_14_2_50_48_46]PIW45485.1 MAG: hypothetical protein COW20_20365 [bacterium (Candidatus Blackallbacteria) CG13_big_fil_rev_8_21_14_2_50_49_14]